MIIFSYVLYAAGLVAALAAATAAVVYDIRGFRIPNRLSLVILGAVAVAAFGIWVAPTGPAPTFVPVSHLISGGVVFVLTLFLFGARMLGAGDAKLLSVLALWFPVLNLASFIFLMSLLGGVVGVLTLLMKRFQPFKNPPAGSWMQSAQAGDRRVPYGIAIGLAFWGAVYLSGYFSVLKFINP